MQKEKYIVCAIRKKKQILYFSNQPPATIRKQTLFCLLSRTSVSGSLLPRPGPSTYLYFYRHVIYDIGAEILILQRLNYSQTLLFCKSIILEEIKSSGPPPLDFSAKTRFKAFWDVFF